MADLRTSAFTQHVREASKKKLRAHTNKKSGLLAFNKPIVVSLSLKHGDVLFLIEKYGSKRGLLTRWVSAVISKVGDLRLPNGA